MAGETPPAGSGVTDTSGTAANSINDSIAKQQQILAMSMQANTAMAYLQMALGVTSKISGR
jgi:hypothetical protein